MKLFAWRTYHYANHSFYVCAEDKEAARKSVEKFIADHLNKHDEEELDSISIEGWGTDRYELIEAAPGVVITHVMMIEEDMDKYILKNKAPVIEPNIRKWDLWMQDIANRSVDRTSIGDCEISTVFLGVDYSYDKDRPVLFETIVFGGPLDDEMDRYCTWEEAEEGHRNMVARVKRACQ